MCREKLKITLEFRFFSFLFLFLFLTGKNDWGSLLSFVLIYLWITCIFQLKRNKKWTFFTFFVTLFHSFCGKLLLFSKFCIMVCFLESYFLQCSFWELSRLLSFLPVSWQEKALSIYITFRQAKVVRKELQNNGIYTHFLLYFKHKENHLVAKRYYFLRKSSISFSFDTSIFLLLHILLFLIYFC